ncbi:hypothetical protein DFH11DRAFT_1731153 [Phellopilus nigrolimitatus]|nr:hypothetical protein DFH11DRAFT_1731153 [Phellopilus nigrolimitatus]
MRRRRRRGVLPQARFSILLQMRGSGRLSRAGGSAARYAAAWPLLRSDGPVGVYSAADTGAYACAALRDRLMCLGADMHVPPEIITPRALVAALNDALRARAVAAAAAGDDGDTAEIEDVVLREVDAATFEAALPLREELWLQVRVRRPPSSFLGLTARSPARLRTDAEEENKKEREKERRAGARALPEAPPHVRVGARAHGRAARRGARARRHGGVRGGGHGGGGGGLNAERWAEKGKGKGKEAGPRKQEAHR